jgi:hypothetical protein
VIAGMVVRRPAKGSQTCGRWTQAGKNKIPLVQTTLWESEPDWGTAPPIP